MIYSAPLNKLIFQFKASYPTGLTPTLARPLLLSLREHYTGFERPDLIVPTPSHWRKKWQRGFNPSHYLAEHLAQQLNIPLAPILKQVAAKPDQKTLSRKQRLRNLNNIFSCNPSPKQTVKNKHIALVDDVITTGATVDALSKCLIEHGAKQVDIWALARTPKPVAL